MPSSFFLQPAPCLLLPPEGLRGSTPRPRMPPAPSENEEEGVEFLRYAQLLQPSKDLATNWAVNVARELEAYLAQLSLTAIIQEDGHNSLNFAQAALVIQGSIQVYSRKVEYLYSLVLQALEFIAQNKRNQHDKSSIQANGEDIDVIEAKEEDFLNLDDVPEEANIDIDDNTDHSKGSNPPSKPPTSLLVVVEGDNLEAAGDAAGELGSYQIYTSSLHRDFLLLDPCDAHSVDEYLKENIASGKKQTPGGGSAHRKTPRGGNSTPSRKTSQAQERDVFRSGKEINNSAPRSGGDWAHDLFNQLEEDFDEAGTETFENGEVEDDDEDDPWEPLNPHAPGALPIKPYKRGKLQRKRQNRKALDFVEFPLASRKEISLLDMKRYLQTEGARDQEARISKKNQSPPPYEKLRSSFSLHAVSFNGMIGQDDDYEQDDFETENGVWDSTDQSGGMYETNIVDNIGSQELTQPSNMEERGNNDVHDQDFHSLDKQSDEVLSFEDLCRAHLDALLKNLAEAEVRTELATRVSGWKQKIEKSLHQEESYPPFDIHRYGEHVLEKISFADAAVNGEAREMAFGEIVRGQEKHEVARTFASLLQLVNNGNVTLEKGKGRNSSFCFTVESSFAVKLLCLNNRQQEMLQHQALSKVRRNSSPAGRKGRTKTPQRILENLNGTSSGLSFNHDQVLISNLLTPSRSSLENAGRLSIDANGTNTGRLTRGSSGTKTTPEGKRRKRQQSPKVVRLKLS